LIKRIITGDIQSSIISDDERNIITFFVNARGCPRVDGFLLAFTISDRTSGAITFTANPSFLPKLTENTKMLDQRNFAIEVVDMKNDQRFAIGEFITPLIDTKITKIRIDISARDTVDEENPFTKLKEGVVSGFIWDDEFNRIAKSPSFILSEVGRSIGLVEFIFEENLLKKGSNYIVGIRIDSGDDYIFSYTASTKSTETPNHHSVIDINPAINSEVSFIPLNKGKHYYRYNSLWGRWFVSVLHPISQAAF